MYSYIIITDISVIILLLYSYKYFSSVLSHLHSFWLVCCWKIRLPVTMQKRYQKVISFLQCYYFTMISFLQCYYFAAKLLIINNYLSSNQFLMLKIRFSNFQNNEYDVMIARDVIFHATSGAKKNDVIKVDVMWRLHFTTVIKFWDLLLLYKPALPI